jgi:hypothetical protein
MTCLSVQVVEEVLQEFATLSGLQANPSKSNMFCAGINGREKQRNFDCLQMKESALPVKYLGVPLISLKLTTVDCGGRFA